jgi:hypothetical protein
VYNQKSALRGEQQVTVVRSTSQKVLSSLCSAAAAAGRPSASSDSSDFGGYRGKLGEDKKALNFFLLHKLMQYFHIIFFS